MPQAESNKLWFVVVGDVSDESNNMDLFVYAQDAPTAAHIWQSYFEGYTMPKEITLLCVQETTPELVQRALTWEDLAPRKTTINVASIMNYNIR